MGGLGGVLGGLGVIWGCLGAVAKEPRTVRERLNTARPLAGAKACWMTAILPCHYPPPGPQGRDERRVRQEDAKGIIIIVEALYV